MLPELSENDRKLHHFFRICGEMTENYSIFSPKMSGALRKVKMAKITV